MKQGKWIWNFGDFELHHRMLLETRREYKNIAFPAFWQLSDCERNVFFRKTVFLNAPETIEFYVDGISSFRANNSYEMIEKPITLPAGEINLLITVCNPTGVPSILIKGETVFTDESWQVSANYDVAFGPVGSWYFDTAEARPSAFALPTKEIEYTELPNTEGVLIDAGKETFCKLELTLSGKGSATVYYGESLTEAMSKNSIIHQIVDKPGHYLFKPRAFRYLFIITENAFISDIHLHFEYLPLESVGSFSCSDEKINKIRDVAEYTLFLNSREFFLDGIKRDRWVWSGDAYQSYLLNYYCFFDKDIVRRTTLALRGKDPMTKHINSILDYSFYWFMGLSDYYLYTGDLSFIQNLWDRAVSLMGFCLSRLDKNGLASKVEQDWIFIDWSKMDKDGAVCAEQMLMARSLQILAGFAELLDKDGTKYKTLADTVIQKLELYWDEEKGGYIDTFESGKRNITRHANIFALLFGFCDEKRRDTIIRCVLQNDAIEQITTPYFQFYQLDSLCRLGFQPEVTAMMRDYWGGMLDLGATSFWEQFLPHQSGDEHYAMYGDPFGCSLCHAWGASPIYLLGRHYLGIAPTKPGYETYEVCPNLGGLDWISGKVPTPHGTIEINADKTSVTVTSPMAGGVLRYGGRSIEIPKGETITLQV